MITLRNKLYESLLDDEDDLINASDENVLVQEFYKECRELMPNLNEKNILEDCKFSNGKIYINRQVYISQGKRQPSEYGNYLFKGFSVSSDIEYIDWIVLAKPYFMSKINPNKYSISKINKYPMNIKNLHWMSLNSWNILDYCPNIKIDKIQRLDISIIPDTGIPDSKVFEFFKCVKNIKECNIQGDPYASLFGSNNIVIPPGLIRNINTNIIRLHIGHILNGAYSKTDINNDNKPTFDKFIDDLYKYNKINKIIIDVSFKRGQMAGKSYLVERGKSKNSKYVLKLIKDSDWSAFDN